MGIPMSSVHKGGERRVGVRHDSRREQEGIARKNEANKQPSFHKDDAKNPYESK